MAINIPANSYAAIAPDTTGSHDLPEHPLFRQFGTAQGLPSASVHKLAQDRSGNLWIATLDGLARYDGVGFKVWRHDPDDPGSLPANDVQHVLVDARDRVWLALQNAGVARYEPETDRFARWQHDADDPASLPSNLIWSLADDGAGGVWLGGYNSGLIHIDGENRMQAYRHDPAQANSLCEDIVLSLARDAEGSVWIGGNRGLCRWRDGEGFQPVAVAGVDIPVAISGIRIEGGTPWLATGLGVRVPAGFSVPDVPAELTSVRGFAIDVEPDGNLWFGSLQGIRRWHRPSGGVAVHPARPGRSLSLQAANIQDVLRDHEGSLWFATHGGGLAQLVPSWRAVRVYLADPDRADGLPGARTRMIAAAPDGQLWISHVGEGIDQLDPASGRSRHWPFAVTGHTRDLRPGALAILVDRQGDVWTGHRSAVVRFRPGDGTLQRFDVDAGGQTLPDTLVRRLAELPDGRIVAAFGGNGVAWLDAGDGSLRFDALGDAADLPCTQASDVRVDAEGAVWLACDRGLLRAASAGERFNVVAGAPDRTIHGLAFDSDGTLWLHALGHLGRYRVHGATLTLLQSIGSREGWPAIDAGGVAVDPDGVVWVTSQRGLHAYEPANARISLFDEAHGLPSAEFIDTPPTWLTPTLLAAATMAGPVLIDTRRLRAPLPTATLRWHQASVQRDGRELALPTGTENAWNLGYNDRDLRIGVRLGSLLKPDAHRYRFRLDGDTWHEQSGQPERVIEHLTSGQHLLEVEAFGSDGQPAGNRLQQRLHIGLPPWRQPWALALYALAVLALMLLTHRAYRRRLERRHALALASERQHWAEQSSAAKTRFLASVGHEIRTPMAGLLGMNELLLGTRLDARQQHFAGSVQRAGTHMLNLVNDLLDLSRIEAGQLTLDVAPVDLLGCFDEVIGELAAHAESKGLTLSQRIEAGTPLHVITDSKRLHQVLLNLVNNAIKFTSQGHVRIRLSFEGGRHRFEVIDNGPGVSAELSSRLFERYSQDEAGRRSGGSGLGLAIARELTELMRGEIGVEPADGGGSRFWLHVPLTIDPDMIADAPEHAGAPLRVQVVDDDTLRGNDLATSLRALAVNVVDAGKPSDDISDAHNGDIEPDTTIMLIAASSVEHARPLLARYPAHCIVLSLPLACNAPASSARLDVLPGPWQLRPLLAALHRLSSLASCGARGDAPEPAAEPTSATDAQTLAGLNVLLVEDDPILGEVMTSQLQRRGATVHLAVDGLAALSMAGIHHHDAIVLDLDLPELDGLTVLTMLARTLSPLPPVLVATARQQPDDEARCLAAGARSFFRKPVDADVLAAALLGWIHATREDR